MAVHWGGRGPGHMSRKSATGRSWADFTATTGWVESPDNTFTRNTANSWTPRVTSNTAFTGAVRMEGEFISGADSCFGLDNNRLVTITYRCKYSWYFTPTSQTFLSGVVRTSNGVPVAGDIYGVRKYWNGTDWTIEWYRTRSGATTVLDTLTTATDESLGVLYGAFLNTASSSLSGASA